MVIVAQLVRASDCGSEGRRFEPGLSPFHKPGNENYRVFSLLNILSIYVLLPSIKKKCIFF